MYRFSLLLLVAAFATPAFAEDAAPTPGAPTAQPTPQAAAPAAPAPDKPAADAGPDIWIFSGVLPGAKEAFSGTLVSGKDDAQFELKISNGATCDGGDFKGDVGMVRLSEIPCTDGRSMRALFVPQGGKLLKVFGHVGDERFAAEAHLLGTEAPPAPKQTAQPTVPQVQPPQAPAGAPGQIQGPQ